jgi:transcriptional regulator NrdR family protein
MLKCPVCSEATKVSYSWISKKGIRSRRYICIHQHRFTSQEEVVRVQSTPTSKGKPPQTLTTSMP